MNETYSILNISKFCYEFYLEEEDFDETEWQLILSTSNKVCDLIDGVIVITIHNQIILKINDSFWTGQEYFDADEIINYIKDQK